MVGSPKRMMRSEVIVSTPLPASTEVLYLTYPSTYLIYFPLPMSWGISFLFPLRLTPSRRLTVSLDGFESYCYIVAMRGRGRWALVVIRCMVNCWSESHYYSSTILSHSTMLLVPLRLSYKLDLLFLIETSVINFYFTYLIITNCKMIFYNNIVIINY